MKKINTLGLGLAAAMIATATTANASFIYADSVAIVTGGTAGTGALNSDFSVDNLMDEGLSSTSDTISTALGANTAYASNFTFPASILFEFSVGQTLSELHIWNYAFKGGVETGGINAFTLDFFDGAGGTGSAIGAQVSDTTPIAALPTISVDTTTFSDRVGVRSVLLTMNTSQGGTFVGAREIAFNAVPEPSSTALLGLGGLALILRRRK